MITITSTEQFKQLVKDAYKNQVGISDEQAEELSSTAANKLNITTEVSGSGQ